MKKFLLRYLAGLVSSACVFSTAIHHLGWLAGLPIGIAYNFLFWYVAEAKPKNVIEFPGSFKIKVKKPFGFNLNDREVVLQAGEAIEVKVKDACSAVKITFTDENVRNDDDRILDAKYIGE